MTDAPMFDMLRMPIPQAPTGKRKGGMFGGVSIDPGAFLAAFAAGMGNPAGLQALRAIHDKRMAAQQQMLEEEQYQRHRSDQMQDWQAQEQWKIDHPEARAPHYFESNSGDQYTIGPDGKPVEVFHDPFRYKLVPNGMGGVVPVDIGSLMGGPQKPVGKLTPIDEGGPMPSASGGFPRY